MKYLKKKIALFVGICLLVPQVAFAKPEDTSWLTVTHFETRKNFKLDRGEGCNYLTDAYIKLTGKQLPTVTESRFIDVNTKVQPFILQADALALVGGTSKRMFSPNKSLLREDWAIMLYNLVRTAYPNFTFPDHKNVVFSDEVASYALPSLRFAYSYGIIEKKGDGYIGAKDTLSLKEAIIMLNKTIQAAPDFPLYSNKYQTRRAYLTFDDSTSKNTPVILDILKKYNVKATFFLAGKSDPALLQRIVAEGHRIGNHTNTHKYTSIYSSPESFWTDFNEQQTYLKEVTGVTPTLVRFPGGSNNTIGTRNSVMETITAQAKLNGYDYFDWNVDSGDATGKTIPKQTIVNNVLNGSRYKSEAIILMHQTAPKTTTAEALPEIIEGLTKMRFGIGVLKPNSYHAQFLK